MPQSGQRSHKWVSGVRGGTGPLIAQCLVVALVIVNNRADAISYRKDTGFATDGKDQFVFRAPEATSVGPRPGTIIAFQAQDVKRAGRVRFVDSSEQHRSDSSAPFFAPSSSAPNVVPFYNQGDPDQGGDKFYTVGASIQFAGAGGDTITPPPPPPPADTRDGQTVAYQQKVKRKKNKFKYANQKVYNVADGQDPYVPFGAPLQDNYLTGAAGPQYDHTIGHYPELQTQQYPFSMSSHYPGAYPSYNGQQASVGGLYQQQQYLQPQYPSPASQPPYAPYRPSPYQGGSAPYYQQQPSNGPPNAQSILGVLQSIFNFAPGTFGVNRPGAAYAPNPAPVPGFPGGVGGQLRQALDNIADNDELQCVPKLICMMSRSSTGQGFSSSVNRGLLSTILGAVPDSSPWLKFSRAALLGYGIGANSCDAYYPKCPKDEMQILYYLNNHRGGFFRFFNNN
ncbi:uncharacterized protein LOC128267191, partial [Anopheles cruzii]|uniref:uncharacterized protein LOC128267191 n=1 Tax=Anopheles cruzii TaxID=68878 RepID=UPI0022EC5017